MCDVLLICQDGVLLCLFDSLRLKYSEGVKMLREAGVEMGDEEDLR